MSGKRTVLALHFSPKFSKASGCCHGIYCHSKTWISNIMCLCTAVCIVSYVYAIVYMYSCVCAVVCIVVCNCMCVQLYVYTVVCIYTAMCTVEYVHGVYSYVYASSAMNSCIYSCICI